MKGRVAVGRIRKYGFGGRGCGARGAFKEEVGCAATHAGPDDCDRLQDFEGLNVLDWCVGRGCKCRMGLCSICGWKVWKRSFGAKEIRRGKELGELVDLKMELAKVHGGVYIF